MTDHEYELLTQAVTALGDILRQNNAGAAIIADKLDELHAIIEKTTPAPSSQFAVGDEVVVWSTGERIYVHQAHPWDEGLYRCGKIRETWDWYDADQLLLIPPQPPDTDEYEVGPYKVPDENDEGWLALDCQEPRWFTENPWSRDFEQFDHGYRYTISRVPKPKFEDGACVLVGPEGYDPGLIVSVMGKPRIESGGTLYLVSDADAQVRWERESDLELVSEADEAPRRVIPDTPPKFYGREMRWKRDKDGNVLCQSPHCDEHYLLRGEVAVWHYPTTGYHIFPICEPVPDDAPRETLPDSPPDYCGQKMRWVKLANGDVVERYPLCDEFFWQRATNRVLCADTVIEGDYPICEPVPCVAAAYEECAKIAEAEVGPLPLSEHMHQESEYWQARRDVGYLICGAIRTRASEVAKGEKT